MREKRPIYFNFKISESEKAQLKKDAHRHEMNISEYLRFLIKQEREKNGD